VPSSGAEVLVVAEQLRRRAPGGIGTYTTGLLSGLAGLASSDELDGLGVRIYASAPPAVPDPLAAFGFPVATSRLSDRALVAAWDRGLRRAPSGASLVHSVSLSGPSALVPLVVTVYDLAWRHVPQAFPPRGLRWHEAALARAKRRRAHLIVPSEATRADLLDAGIAPEQMTLIPAGVDHLVPADAAATAALCASAGIEGGFLLAVGTFEPRKNLHRLVEAYGRARQDGLDLPLLLVGPQGWGPGITPPEGVIRIGRVEDAVLSGLYERATVVCYVPLIEGFGLPALEAMALGAPVISSAVPSVGGASRLVDPLDVDAIAAGLLEVCGDAEVRAALVTAGRAHAATFTWEACARAHVALWSDLLSR
jgi:glycosyltransferase involved in cell wall biosynthesis